MKSKILLFLAIISVLQISTVCFAQNHFQIGFAHNLTSPMEDIQTEQGTFTPVFNIGSLQSSNLQFGTVFNRFKKVKMELFLTGNLVVHKTVTTSQNEFLNPGDSLDIAYSGDQIQVVSGYKGSEFKYRTFQVGYIFQYQYSKHLSFGSGIWFRFMAGNHNTVLTKQFYFWDENKYRKREYWTNFKTDDKVPTDVYSISDRERIVQRNFMVPLKVKYTLPLKSGDCIGVFAQTNLGYKYQNYWLGLCFEF